MDYIENFSCFQEFALQQDHFAHEQITIFVILCFRHRRAGEEVCLRDPTCVMISAHRNLCQVEAQTFKLPSHVTCELHAFLSSDGDHDTGFAQMCIHMVMTAKEDGGLLPRRVKNWSDGGRAHFKNYRQLMFMAHLSRRYGTEWWWSFFQSCHGVSSLCLFDSGLNHIYCRQRNARRCRCMDQVLCGSGMLGRGRYLIRGGFLPLLHHVFECQYQQ